jgi:predicted transcriptional regulator
VFVNADKFSRPIARFIKELDGQIGKASDKASVVVIWVGGDTDKNKEYLPKVQMSIKLENSSMAVYTGEAPGPKDWALNPDAHATVVVAHQGKVVKSLAYESLNDTEVKKVIETLTTALKK